MSSEYPRGTVTLLFTDLEGSSELSEQHGLAFEPVRETHFRLLREALTAAGGFECKTAGDALFAAFERASDAVKYAVAVQRLFLNHPWPAAIGALRVRIGMHTGEPFLADEHGRPDYRGPAVNRAARVQAAGHGGQILVSQATLDLARADLPPEVTFESRGIHRLKGVGEDQLWQVCHPELPATFPPLNTLNPERHNLPAPPAPLIGRDSEVASWRAVLSQPGTRLLTLVGPGGMGKTRTALQLAEHCISEFKHGVWWSSLEDARTGEEMLAGLAASLRFTPQPQPGIQSQIARFLRERQLLLVLDNVEQIPDAPRAIGALLQECPGLKCLVTSRRRLGVRAEVVRELEPLSADEAVRLFVERGATQREGFQLTPANTADVAELCRQLEGLPLALELAASRLALLTPREVLRRLDQQFRVLSTSSPDLPPRQRALHATIEWSFHLLTPAEQSLFCQLAVFKGGFDLAAAEAVGEAPEVADAVLTLRRHSLLRDVSNSRLQQTRFAMLESIRAFAASRLAEQADLAAVATARHAAYFANWASERAPALRQRTGEAAALAELGGEQDNLRAALDFNLTSPAPGPATVAELGWVFCAWLQHRGFWAEAVTRSDAMLGKATDWPPATRAALLRQRAGLHLDYFEAEAAARHARTALELARAAGSATEEAEALNLLGLAANRAGQLAEALALLQQALACFRVQRDDAGAAKVLNNLGFVETNRVLAQQPDATPQTAQSYLEEALRLHRARADQRGLAETQTNLGVLVQARGDLAEANAHYTEALASEIELGHKVGVARALYNLAEIAGLRGQAADGQQLAAAAEYLFTEAGSPLARPASELKAQLTAQAGANSVGETTFQGRPLPEVVRIAMQGALER